MLIVTCPEHICPNKIDPTELELERLKELKDREPWLDVPATFTNTNCTAREESVQICDDPVNNELKSTPPPATADDLESFEPKIPLSDNEYWLKYFKQFCDDSCLLRYLRANQMNVDKAFDGLVSTMSWRRKYQPHLITPAEVEANGQTGKQYSHGFSKQGYPILYLRNNREDSKDYRMNMRAFVYHIEHLIRVMPTGVERLVLIFDFTYWSPSNATPMHVSRYFLHLFASHYPERLGYIFPCNAPWLFWAFYKVISPFIHPVTKAKFRFVTLKSMKRITREKETPDNSNILHYVDSDQLEDEFGGENEYEYEPQAYWRAHSEFYQQYCTSSDVTNAKSVQGVDRPENQQVGINGGEVNEEEEEEEEDIVDSISFKTAKVELFEREE